MGCLSIRLGRCGWARRRRRRRVFCPLTGKQAVGGSGQFHDSNLYGGGTLPPGFEHLESLRSCICVCVCVCVCVCCVCVSRVDAVVGLRASREAQIISCVRAYACIPCACVCVRACETVCLSVSHPPLPLSWTRMCV
jgi:hypothetical protein